MFPRQLAVEFLCEVSQQLWLVAAAAYFCFKPLAVNFSERACKPILNLSFYSWSTREVETPKVCVRNETKT